MFNVVEHIFETKNLLVETRRILNKGGKLYGSTPFMYRYHKDPEDYYRYTHEAMELLLKKTGYSKYIVKKFGIGEFTVAVQQFSHVLKFRTLIYFSWLIAIFFDFLLYKFRGQRDPKDYYLGLYLQ